MDQHVERANIHLGFGVKQLHRYAMANLSSGIKIDNFGVIVVTSNEYKAWYSIFTMDDNGGGAFFFCIADLK